MQLKYEQRMFSNQLRVHQFPVAFHVSQIQNWFAVYIIVMGYAVYLSLFRHVASPAFLD